jgi:hypothetical protein
MLAAYRSRKGVQMHSAHLCDKTGVKPVFIFKEMRRAIFGQV